MAGGAMPGDKGQAAPSAHAQESAGAVGGGGERSEPPGYLQARRQIGMLFSEAARAKHLAQSELSDDDAKVEAGGLARGARTLAIDLESLAAKALTQDGMAPAIPLVLKQVSAILRPAEAIPDLYEDGKTALEAVAEVYRQAVEAAALLPSVEWQPTSAPVHDEEASGVGRRVPEAPLVRFSPAAYAALEALSRRKGKTVEETLREALALETWVEDTRRAGGKVLVERNGKLQELVGV